MTTLPKIISTPTINYSKRPLQEAILGNASRDLGNVLIRTFRCLSDEHEQQLMALTPADSTESKQLISVWIARLEIVKSALGNFPIPVSPIGTTVARKAVTKPTLALHNTDSEKDALDSQQHCSPNLTAKKACLERDQYQCLITGLKASDGFDIDVAYIIPPEFANHPQCRHQHFWKMLDLFYGEPATDNLFAALLDNIFSVQNLVSLDSSVRGRFIDGSLTLTPKSDQYCVLYELDQHVGEYWLSVGYSMVVDQPGPAFVQSTDSNSAGNTTTLCPGTKVHMLYPDPLVDMSKTAPLPTHFALRDSILSVKHDCEYVPPCRDDLPSLTSTLTGSLVPSLGLNTTNRWSPQQDVYYNSGNDTVLAAIAILDGLVASGQLPRSP